MSDSKTLYDEDIVAWAEQQEHGEIDAIDANSLRRSRYSLEQVLGNWFPEEPPRTE